MRPPTNKDLRAEIVRLRAENERLKRLVQSQRPELEQLRDVECRLRDIMFNLPQRLNEVHQLAASLLPPNCDDLPTMAEIGGIGSPGRDRVIAALGEGD